MINRTKVKESTQIKPGDNGDVLVMKDNAPEWSTPSDADLAKASETDTKLAEKQDKLTAGDNIHIVGNTISADGKPTPIAIGTVTSGEVPMVSNSGTDTDVVLNFVLPKGDKGDKGDQGLQGPQGPVGAPFQVKKVYDSVEAMNADYSGSDVAVGEFVLIDTGDVQDPDNSKLYVKGPTQYDFVTDLSGAQGIQGPQGTPGTPAGFGNITATVDNTTGTPQVSVQADGPNTAKNISFSFTGLKGEKGDKGDPGGAGAEVNSIAPLTTETPPLATGPYSISIGDRAKSTAQSSVSFGPSAVASGTASLAIGFRSNSSSPDTTAIGSFASASDSGSVSIGTRSSSTSSSVSVGTGSESSNQGTAIGYGANATSTYLNSGSTSIGASASAPGLSAVAVGYGSESSADMAAAIGYNSSAAGLRSVAIGSDSAATSTDEFSIGSDSLQRRITHVSDPTNDQDAATKNYVDTKISEIPAGTEVNILSKTKTNNPIDFRDNAQESLLFGESLDEQSQAIVIGGKVYGVARASGSGYSGNLTYEGIVASPSGEVVIGKGKMGMGAVAIGEIFTMGEDYRDFVAIGAGATSTGVMGNRAVAIGGASAYADNSVAIGHQSRTDASDAFAVGQDDAIAGRNQVLRRIVGVKNPTQEHDAANKNYVDTQLTPINAKLQYVPENTNQILSQIETNAEKAQSAAEAAQATAESKASQADLTALQTTVTQLQATVTQLQSTIANLTLETERI